MDKDFTIVGDMADAILDPQMLDIWERQAQTYIDDKSRLYVSTPPEMLMCLIRYYRRHRATAR